MFKKCLVAATATVVSALPAIATAYEAGDWIVRGGAALVEPDESSSEVKINGAGVPDTGLGADNDTQLGLTVSYMLSDKIGVELLASTPFKHSVSLIDPNSSIAGTGTPIATVEHLPPTLSLQYFFLDASSALQPYAGVGINYWIVVDDELSSAVKAAPFNARGLDIDNSVGLALQLGVDYQLQDNWLINAAIWKIDVDTDASFQTDVGKVSAEIDIDPWVYMVSVGYKF